MRQIIVAMVLLLVVSYCAVAEREQQELSEKLIRLHVTADSDSAQDQAFKLQVRDSVLEAVTPLLQGVVARDDALLRLAGALPQLNTSLADYGAAATIVREQFPTRVYGTFTLPAGEYIALRVTVGSGEGHNWWCVVFPALCTATVTDTFTDDSSTTDAFALLSDDDVALITGDDGTIIKFRLLDVIGNLRRYADALFS